MTPGLVDAFIVVIASLVLAAFALAVKVNRNDDERRRRLAEQPMTVRAVRPGGLFRRTRVTWW